MSTNTAKFIGDTLKDSVSRLPEKARLTTEPRDQHSLLGGRGCSPLRLPFSSGLPGHRLCARQRASSRIHPLYDLTPRTTDPFGGQVEGVLWHWEWRSSRRAFWRVGKSRQPALGACPGSVFLREGNGGNASGPPTRVPLSPWPRGPGVLSRAWAFCWRVSFGEKRNEMSQQSPGQWTAWGETAVARVPGPAGAQALRELRWVPAPPVTWRWA